MKKNSLGGVAFLVAAVLLAAWFEWRDGPRDEAASTASQDTQNYMLAVSWQPAFCERRPNRAECRSQRAGRFDASNFSLHGLWPQPRSSGYCGVSSQLMALDKRGRWRDLPKLDLSDGLRRELSEKMPGYRSYLHRHEWIKHGTCIPSMTPEAYFAISLDLLDALNASAVAQVFRDNIDRRLDYRDLDRAFARVFGDDAGTRLVADCYRDDGRRIFQELKLSLSGDLFADPQLQSLVLAGPNLGSSCPSGVIDPVGLQ